MEEGEGEEEEGGGKREVAVMCTLVLARSEGVRWEGVRSDGVRWEVVKWEGVMGEGVRWDGGWSK